MERFAPLLFDEPFFAIGVSGERADPKALWPEVWTAVDWGKVTDLAEWEEREISSSFAK